MNRQQRRGLQIVLSIVVMIGLLLLLIPQATGHGIGLPACFVLLPVLLFGLIRLPHSLWPPAEAGLTVRHQFLDRTPLFQRPPPIA